MYKKLQKSQTRDSCHMPKKIRAIKVTEKGNSERILAQIQRKQFTQKTEIIEIKWGTSFQPNQRTVRLVAWQLLHVNKRSMFIKYSSC